jgi:hypothetical protein
MIFGNPVKSKSASTPQISEMPKIAAAVSTTNHFTPDQSGPCMPTVGHGKLASSGERPRRALRFRNRAVVVMMACHCVSAMV